MKNKDALEIFQTILRMDTSKRNEQMAIDYLQTLLHEHQIDSEIILSPNNRANLIAKINAHNNKIPALGNSMCPSLDNSTIPPLVMLSHIDVVPTDNTDDWIYGPFDGTLAEDSIWGRGTLDTKQLTVMHLMAFLELKKQPLNREVYFIVTADEESGSKEGMEFLVKGHAEIFRKATVLSEGGGFTVPLSNNQTCILFASAEKGTALVRLHAKGPGGHAASPPKQTAAANLIEKLSTLLNLQHEIDKDDNLIINRFTEVFGEKNKTSEKLPTQLKEYISQMTFRIENFEIGDSLNIIPNKGFVDIQFRTLPEMTREDFIQQMKNVFPANETWELKEFQKGYTSNPDHDILKLFKKQAEELGFYAQWVPFTALGRTDGRFIAELAENIYGLSPVYTSFTEVLKRVHQANERLEIDSFEFGVELMKRTILEYCKFQGGANQDV